MAREIPLTKGSVAIVDDADYEELNRYKWHLSVNGYAARRKGAKIIYMHRQILDAPPDKKVDHINQNKIDNRKTNIRICTHKENLRNRGRQANNTSGYTGVGFHEYAYRAYIKKDGKMYSLGYHKDINDAARMYNFWAVHMFGDFACLNDIDGVKGTVVAYG